MNDKSLETLIQTMGDYDSSDDAKIVLNAIVASLTEALINGEEIVLDGLGFLKVIEKEAPIKGPTKIPGYSYPKEEIRTVKQLKESIRQNLHVIKTVDCTFDETLKKKINELNK